jgi:hypothetical protein
LLKTIIPVKKYLTPEFSLFIMFSAYVEKGVSNEKIYGIGIEDIESFTGLPHPCPFPEGHKTGKSGRGSEWSPRGYTRRNTVAGWQEKAVGS